MPVPSKKGVPADRREWLRIDDRLPLEVRRAGSPPEPCGGADGEALASIQEFLARPAQELAARTGQGDPQAALVPWVLKMDWALGVMLNTLARLAPGGLAIPRMTDVNISATGMSFVSAQLFDAAEVIILKVILPPFLPIQTSAEIVWCTPVEGGPPGQYLVAVKFLDLRTDEQDYLIRHILELQSERLRTKRRSEE